MLSADFYLGLDLGLKSRVSVYKVHVTSQATELHLRDRMPGGI